MGKPLRIVFTGGPSGGKTSIIEILRRHFGRQAAVVPEAATILYKGGFPRWPGDVFMRHIQRAIYFTARELEDAAFSFDQPRCFLCDRGTMDCMAYWPPGEPDFLASTGTTLEKELDRYDIVVHLRPPLNSEVYSRSSTRIESHKEAIELDKRLEKVWERHKKRYIISDEPDFLLKVNAVIGVLEKELPGIKAEG